MVGIPIEYSFLEKSKILNQIKILGGIQSELSRTNETSYQKLEKQIEKMNIKIKNMESHKQHK